MESMGKKPRRRRSFTPEFKAEIVELCQRGERSVGQVARDFDLAETAVREWVKQAGRCRTRGRDRSLPACLFYWAAGGSPSGLPGARIMRAISSMGAWGRCQVGVNPSGMVAPT